MKLLLVLLFGLFTMTAHAQSAVLGEFETKFGTKGENVDRASNVMRAAQLLDGVVLKPTEVFSYNDRVGKRTKENGFREAHVIVDGKLTDGMGGGVCQVSSTLHAAALFAGLPIVEHHVHSRSSLYIGPSYDATVDYGRFDFKFQNNYPFPITIKTDTTTPGHLIVKILGTKVMREVTMGVILTNKKPAKTHLFKVKYLAPGIRKKIEPGTLGCDAYRARIIKYVGTDFETTDEVRYHYDRTDRIIHIGRYLNENEFPLVDDHRGVGLTR